MLRLAKLLETNKSTLSPKPPGRGLLEVALVIAATLGALWSDGASPQFNLAPTYAVENNPDAIVGGDFNSDGKMDLVTANAGNNSISVLFGNGDGTVRPVISYSVRARPFCLAAGDFNHDGNLDIAVGISAGLNTNLVTLMLGNTNGAFTVSTSYTVGRSPCGISVADFNNDGNPDLATANYDGHSVSVLLGAGDGSFTVKTNYSVTGYPTSVVVGDFENDGNSDIAIGKFSYGSTMSVSLLQGQGNGSFVLATNINWGVSIRSIAVCDINADGKGDLLCTTYRADPSAAAGRISVSLANGDGTFQTPVLYDAGLLSGRGTPSTTPRSVAVGDLDGDGIQDLVAPGGGEDAVSILLGRSDGTFTMPIKYAVGAVPYSVALVDLDGDSKLDIAVANGGIVDSGLTTEPFYETYGTVSILINKGDGEFEAPHKHGAIDFPRFLAVGDFDRDGVADVVTANSTTNRISVLLGSGPAPLANATDYVVGTIEGSYYSGPSAIAVADLNDDGFQDLIVAATFQNYYFVALSNGLVSVLFGNGDGTFGLPVNYLTGIQPRSLAIADFNEDGKPDVVTANYQGSSSNSLSLLFGDVNGTFRTAVQLTLPGATSTYFAVAEDFDGDGHLDLAAALVRGGNSNSVGILHGDGNGTFSPPQFHDTTNRVTFIAVADLDRDGKQDLVTANTIQGGESQRRGDARAVSVWRGVANGDFAVPVSYLAGTYPRSLAVRDFDGDGILDIAVVSYNGQGLTAFGNLSLLLGRGDGTYSAASKFDVGSRAYSLAIADFDLDGRPDLVIANSSLTLLLNYTAPTLQILEGEGGLEIRWPAWSGYVIESTSDLVQPIPWRALTNVVTETNFSKRTTLDPQARGLEFFRLKKL